MVVDKFSRQCLAIHVEQSKGDDVVAVMIGLHQMLGVVPGRIQTDNVSELISKTLDK